MKSLVVNTYYLVQIFTVTTGLVHIELFMAGLARHEQPMIWWFQILKLALVVIFALTTQAKKKLTLFLYLPQLIFDMFILFTTNTRWEAIALILAFLQVLITIYWLDIGAHRAPKKRKVPAAHRRSVRHFS